MIVESPRRRRYYYYYYYTTDRDSWAFLPTVASYLVVARCTRSEANPL